MSPADGLAAIGLARSRSDQFVALTQPEVLALPDRPGQQAPVIRPAELLEELGPLPPAD